MVFHTNLLLSDFEGLNWLMSKRSIQLFSVMVGLFFGGVFLQKLGLVPILLLIVLLITAAALLVGRLYIKWRSKTIFSRAAVSEHLTLTLDDHGIIQLGDSGETELLWDDVFRVCKNKVSYFVFLNQKQAFYFQKRSFAEGQEEIFLKLIRDHVDSSKIKF